MTGRLENRVARLEGRLPLHEEFERMTYDELAVKVLDGLRQVIADAELGQDERAVVAAEVEKIEAAARWQAALAQHPAYAAALNRIGELIPDFVPAIFGRVGCEDGWVEVEDFEKPQLMERRAALRSRPDIQKLIEAGAQEIAAVDFGGRYVAAAFSCWSPPTVRRHGRGTKS